MKNILCIFLFLFAVSAFAQEMDTTYMVRATGDTIGLIHKRGELPIVPPELQQEQLQVVPQAGSVQQDIPQYSMDSLAYYQALADKYITSGNKMRSTGKGLMLGGGLGAGLGLMLMLVGASDTETDYYGDEEMTSSGEMTFFLGYILLISMPEMFVAGIVVKSIGNHRIRRGRIYNEKTRYFQNVGNAFATLRVQPVINPITGSVGGNLAFNF